MAVAARTLRQLRPAVRRSPRSASAARGRERQRVPFLIFAMLVVTALVVGLISAQALVAQDSFRLSELTEQAERLESEYGALRLEVARLSSPDRIASAAREAGLVLPGQVELLKVPGTRSPPPAEPEPGGSVALKGVLGGEG